MFGVMLCHVLALVQAGQQIYERPEDKKTLCDLASLYHRPAYSLHVFEKIPLVAVPSEL